MLESFHEYKKQILEYLKDFLSEKKNHFQKVNFLGNRLIDQILDFSSKGKMIRGGLVFQASKMFGKEIDLNVVRTSAALELLQSSLLIHDDIMDRDFYRRGEKTLFYQYKEMGDLKSFKESYHFGEAMGICVGDIGFFLTFEILSELTTPSSIKDKLLGFYAKESSYVGLAQMQDIYFSFSDDEIQENDILSLYLYKTARYTFSLPLASGAILAEESDFVITQLEKLGEVLGLIFQMKDDELGLFGDEKITGKPIGSDIQEGKKTLFYLYLFQNPENREQLRKIFGNPEIGSQEITLVREMIKKYGIQEKIKAKIEELEKQAVGYIQELPISVQKKSFLDELLKYNLKRTK